MSSPLVRAWLAARLPDWADHAYACWRGTLHTLGISTEWDPLELGPLYTDLPGRDADEVSRAARSLVLSGNIAAGEPHYHTLMPCPVCKVSVGKDCITRYGNVTGPHRARREAAAAQTAAEVQS